MESRGDAFVESQARKRKAMEEAAMLDDDDIFEDEEDMEEDVNPVVVMAGRKHGDGSLYKPKVDKFRWLFKLEVTSETCGRHVGGPMLQIFSVKLAKLPRLATEAATAGPIQLYGFMAVRDLMDPLRNYVFNHSRDDPFVIQHHHSDPFIYQPGPKRGVNMQARVVFEYDVRIKVESSHQDDLPLIDEVAIFSERTCVDEPAAYRIRGDRGGAVDITWALLTGAVEATVQVWIQELDPPQHGDGDGNGGLDLSVSGFVSKIGEEIKLFRGVVEKPCALNRFLVAVSLGSDLILHFKAPAAAGAGLSDHMGEFAFRGTAHGSVSDRRKFDFATIEVQVTWSALY